MSVSRKKMCHLHKVAIGAAMANSLMYFLHCANFAYGGKLVTDQDMTFSEVFRYRIFKCSCDDILVSFL